MHVTGTRRPATDVAMYQRPGDALLNTLSPPPGRVQMMRKTRAWCALAVVAVLGIAAPAAQGSPPVAGTKPPGAGAIRGACTMVELKWPNGTGTGVWAMVCS